MKKVVKENGRIRIVRIEELLEDDDEEFVRERAPNPFPSQIRDTRGGILMLA